MPLPDGVTTVDWNAAEAARLLKLFADACSSSKSGRDMTARQRTPDDLSGTVTSATPEASAMPSGRHSRLSTTEYTAVVTPTPSAIDRTPNTVNNGAASSRRAASARSAALPWSNRAGAKPRSSRHCSL